MKSLPLLSLVAVLAIGCRPSSGPASIAASSSIVSSPATSTNVWNMKDKITKTDAEWRQQLTAEQFKVLRQHGTERAFTGVLVDNHSHGIYRCAGCGLELFGSDTKFESGTGWPSFWKPITEGHVGSTEDNGFFMKRTEVHCARCDGHLGHVFDDGPKPTGQRYCINSASLAFEPKR